MSGVDEGSGAEETPGIQEPEAEPTTAGKLERHRALHGRLTPDNGPPYAERLTLLGLDPGTTDPVY